MIEFTYTFDQLRSGLPEEDDMTFFDFHFTKTHGGVKLHNYFTSDHGTVSAPTPEQACEKLYWIYNYAHPASYSGRSMSVSDIVHLWDNRSDEPVKTSWFCDSFGFVQLDENGHEIKKEDAR